MSTKIEPEIMAKIRVQLRLERRILMSAYGHRPRGVIGQAAFIPSFKPYTREDIALLLADARANGGLLGIGVRNAFLMTQRDDLPSVLAQGLTPEQKTAANRAKHQAHNKLRQARKVERKRRRAG